MKIHKDIPYIKHILDFIKDIEDSVKNLSKEKFKKNKDVKDAIIRRIEIIGEAVKNISEETKSKNLSIPWSKIAGTRDILIHQYFGVDLDAVWNIVKKDLPDLKEQILKLKKNLEKEEN